MGEIGGVDRLGCEDMLSDGSFVPISDIRIARKWTFAVSFT